MTVPRSQAPLLPLPSADGNTSDWDTIWRSEAASLAADREVGELWAAGVAHWTSQASLWADLARFGHDERSDGAGGRTRPDAAPGTSAAPAAPDPVADLERRVAELERRLADRGTEPGR